MEDFDLGYYFMVGSCVLQFILVLLAIIYLIKLIFRR